MPDKFLLEWVDAFVQWVWEWTGLRKDEIVGVFSAIVMGMWLIRYGFTKPLLLVMIGLGCLGTWRLSVRFSRQPPDVANGVVLRTREQAAALFVRAVFYVSILIDCVLIALGTYNWLRLLADVTMAWHLLLFYSLIPMTPRKKIKLPKMSPAPAPSFG